MNSKKIILSEHLALPFKRMVDNGVIIPNKSIITNYIAYPIYKLSKQISIPTWNKK